MKKSYQKFMEERAEKYGWYIIENDATVRATAEIFHVSKTLIHHDVTVILRRCNGILANEVKKVLEKNKSERHIRGGIATRRKYKGE